MSYKVITPPDYTNEANLPVSYDAMKRQCRIDSDTERDQLIGFIIEATDFLEHALNRQFVTATYALILNGFHSWPFPVAPLLEVTAVRYFDQSGQLQTVDPASYIVNSYAEPAVVSSAPYHCWPATACRMDAVQIEFTAGYGSPADIPPRFRNAIRLLAAHFYENREATGERKLESIPFGVQACIEANRVRTFH